jgi:hypothetical protein
MPDVVNIANAPGFRLDPETMNITMNRGDTGAFFVKLTRKGGDAWTDEDRALFTIKNQQGETVMQRIYRLDDQWGIGDGTVLIEFHNDDTDQWASGAYSTELRFDISPIWQGTAPTARCVNALTSSAKMVEGAIVRTKIQSTLTIDGVLGDI